MELLKSLHNLLSRKRLKKIEIITNEPKGRKASLPVQLYHLLGQSDIQTDEQASQALLGKPADSQYRMLKARTKQRNKCGSFNS